MYLIDLSSGGTTVDNFRAERNRPLQVKHGFKLRFGGDKAALVYTLHVEEGCVTSPRTPCACQIR